MTHGRTERASFRGGFTLLEVLVAISILVVITGIVYASFDAVNTATEEARLSLQEMRLRQFLSRSIVQNFGAVYSDPACMNEQFQFIGTSERGAQGAMDSVEFCSTAPLISGTSPPGILKRVHYGATTESSDSIGLSGLGTEDSGNDSISDAMMRFESTEKLLYETYLPATSDAAASRTRNPYPASDGFSQPDSFDKDKKKSQTKSSKESDSLSFETKSPSWSVPIESLELSYFDGKDWVKEWDSLTEGRLPWAVKVRVSFARTEAQVEADHSAGLTTAENPDFETVIALPSGEGVLTDGATWLEASGALGNIYGEQPPRGGEGEGEGETRGARS